MKGPRVGNERWWRGSGKKRSEGMYITPWPSLPLDDFLGVEADSWFHCNLLFQPIFVCLLSIIIPP